MERCHSSTSREMIRIVTLQMTGVPKTYVISGTVSALVKMLRRCAMPEVLSAWQFSVEKCAEQLQKANIASPAEIAVRRWPCPR